MPRPTVKAPAPSETVTGDSLFVPCVSSGSKMLDLVLGGKGWALGRMANLVGDKSTGKTLLAIEMCANLARITDPALIRYAEAESAFDMPYAQSVGCPAGIRLTEPGAIRTIEDFQDDLSDFLKTCPGGDTPAAYVLDSFDAMSSNAEMEADFDRGSYGDGKAKIASKLFRMMVQDIATKNCLLLIVSQIRDKLNVTFGETKTRSGGHSLDFYASQIVWLAQVQSLKRTALNIERTYGVQILAKNKKCKVGKPFRQAELTLMFDYGIDDELSMIGWLKETKRKIPVGDGLMLEPKEVLQLVAELREEHDRAGLQELNAALRMHVQSLWDEIDDRMRPPMSKYG